MRIYFERSGGFAGMLVQATIDTRELPPEEADSLSQMVEDAGFFDLSTPLRSPGGADQFIYQVTIEEGSRSHTIETGDGAAPASLRLLLRELTIRARSSG